MIRSGWPARETAQVECASDVTRDLVARVTGERRSLARMADPSKASACCDVQGDDKAPGIVRRKGRTSKSQTTALAVLKKKKVLLRVHDTLARMWQASSFEHRCIS